MPMARHRVGALAEAETDLRQDPGVDLIRWPAFPCRRFDASINVEEWSGIDQNADYHDSRTARSGRCESRRSWSIRLLLQKALHGQ